MKSKSVEIEIKAHIHDNTLILGKLRENYRFVKEYKKRDTYYSCDTSAGRRNVRIRTTDGQSVVTFKEKTLHNGLEVNQEWETAIENSEKGQALLEYLGCEFRYAKTKEGYLFTDGELTIELSLVAGLGWFLELEYMAESSDRQSVQYAEKAIRNVLKKLQIPDEDIEPRYYAELLLQASEQENPQHS